ncbi:MAG: hypothetical protein KDD62_04520 [Bdellovibrionales bacterium]|nr:hypothetical protein [Bdellovibrionales bacterium]
MRKLNDLDIRRLRDEWPKVKAKQWKRCDKILRLFANSPRFEVLKELRLDSFLDVEFLQDSSLASFSLGDILKRWPDIFFETNVLTPEFLERIIALFENLHGTNDIENEPELEVPELLKEKAATGPVFDRVPRYLPSLEEEKKLRVALRSLREVSHKQIMIAEYWPLDKLRAPFLEELSFDQLYELPLEQITEQRSFTKAKLEMLVEVIHDFVARQQEGTVSAASLEVTKPRHEVRSPQRESFLGAAQGDNFIVNLFHSYLAVQNFNADYLFSDFVRNLATELGPFEQVLFWLHGDVGSDSILELYGEGEQDLNSAVSLVSQKVDALLVGLLPQVSHHWKDSLTQAFVKQEDLIACYSGGCGDNGFHHKLCARILQFLGAQPVTYDRRALPGYICSHPKRFESLTEIVLSGLPSDEATYHEQLALFFPGIQVEELQNFYAHWVEYKASKKRYALRSKKRGSAKSHL